MRLSKDPCYSFKAPIKGVIKLEFVFWRNSRDRKNICPDKVFRERKCTLDSFMLTQCNAVQRFKKLFSETKPKQFKSLKRAFLSLMAYAALHFFGTDKRQWPWCCRDTFWVVLSYLRFPSTLSYSTTCIDVTPDPRRGALVKPIEHNKQAWHFW